MSDHLLPNMISCPVKSCDAHLQRTVDGSLVEGLCAHLATVHQLPGPRALDLATSHYMRVT